MTSQTTWHTNQTNRIKSKVKRVIINFVCNLRLMLHGDVPVRLASGEDVEVKYLKAGDRVETADGGSIGITAIVKESCESAIFATVPGSALRASVRMSVRL